MMVGAPDPIRAGSPCDGTSMTVVNDNFQSAAIGSCLRLTAVCGMDNWYWRLCPSLRSSVTLLPSLAQLIFLPSNGLSFKAIGVLPPSIGCEKSILTTPVGFTDCWPSTTALSSTLTAATAGAGSVLKLKPLLTPRPEVFCASLRLTRYAVFGLIVGRNWNSFGLTALNETTTDGVMLKPCWTDSAFMSWLKRRSMVAVRGTDWSPSLTLALTSSGVVMKRITMAAATTRMAIGASHQRSRSVCVQVIDHSLSREPRSARR